MIVRTQEQIPFSCHNLWILHLKVALLNETLWPFPHWWDFHDGSDYSIVDFLVHFLSNFCTWRTKNVVGASQAVRICVPKFASISQGSMKLEMKRKLYQDIKLFKTLFLLKKCTPNMHWYIPLRLHFENYIWATLWGLLKIQSKTFF